MNNNVPEPDETGVWVQRLGLIDENTQLPLKIFYSICYLNNRLGEN